MEKVELFVCMNVVSLSLDISECMIASQNKAVNYCVDIPQPAGPLTTTERQGAIRLAHFSFLEF